jgi:starch synthase
MRLLLAASEVMGFAKTGGLADVAGALPRALQRRGHECAVILPLYRCARTGRIPIEPTSLTFQVPVGRQLMPGRLWRSALPGSPVTVYLVEQADYFERDDPAEGAGLYQLTRADGAKQDYPDNCARFVFFSRAVLESLRLLNYWPDVLHANDWQTGLVPVYLREFYQRPSAGAPRSAWDSIGALFTIHNIAYQGIFWHWDMELTGLSWRRFNFHELEFHGRLNLLKAGIVFADLLTTVSPTYAREIQTPYYGCGLQGVLAKRNSQLVGIVNGVDYGQWDPATDPHLVERYDPASVAQRKPACKAALQRKLGLTEEPRTPLLGLIARLVEQKGIELIVRAASALAELPAQLVVLGEGDPHYHAQLLQLRARYPDRVALALTFDEPLAHQIEAGADLFLMPSLYEPSGLNQLYSMKYGTLPVVRATGGLADTVVDTTPETITAGRATGFCFLAYTPEALTKTVRRALELYHHSPAEWLQIQRTAMKQDWSWDRSAGEYEKLYLSLVRSQRCET